VRQRGEVVAGTGTQTGKQQTLLASNEVGQARKEWSEHRPRYCKDRDDEPDVLHFDLQVFTNERQQWRYHELALKVNEYCETAGKHNC